MILQPKTNVGSIESNVSGVNDVEFDEVPSIIQTGRTKCHGFFEIHSHQPPLPPTRICAWDMKNKWLVLFTMLVDNADVFGTLRGSYFGIVGGGPV